VVCRECGGTGADGGKLDTCPTCGGKGQLTYRQNTLGGNFVTVRTCSTCGGRGKVIRSRCRYCNGTGRVQTVSRIEVAIPKGAEDGMRLRIPGAGEPGINGGPPGDLYVVLTVRKHSVFDREGENLFYTVEVPFTVAALGGEVDVPHLSGKARLQIPPGTQPGTGLKLAGLGLPRLNGRGNGDLFVTVKVRTPRKLTSEQKELLRKFDSIEEEKGKGFFSRLKNA
ncbi:MAG: molecular chaperone DnaJ, partial [Candidatus Thermoplasmatota archaeon]|nr:molecular chaperone DnaJ [Candidatus Thermoplasmatota archaeon]